MATHGNKLVYIDGIFSQRLHYPLVSFIQPNYLFPILYPATNLISFIMKIAGLLYLASGLSQTLANIPVEYKVTLSCDTSSANYTGCLRGMHCTDEKTCAKPLVHATSDLHFFNKGSKSRSTGRLLARAYSQNGQCGPGNGGLLCDPESTVYTGTCCSQYGWCGNTPAYCGSGCVSGCTDATTTSAGSPSSTEEPVLGSPSTAPANGGDTTNGTCGAGNGNTVCGDWPNGACCSLYGVSLCT